MYSFGSGVALLTCNPSYSRGGGRRIMVWGWLRKKHETLPKKQTKSKKTVGMAQVVENLQDPEFNLQYCKNKQKNTDDRLLERKIGDR
jgi:O-glycosyl hydrolase